MTRCIAKKCSQIHKTASLRLVISVSNACSVFHLSIATFLTSDKSSICPPRTRERQSELCNALIRRHVRIQL